MIDVVWQRLDHGFRASLPFATTLFCTLLSVVAWPLPYIGPVTPPLALIALYYWTLHRPDLFGSALAFFIGLLFDIVNDLPLGLSALLFVAVHYIILYQRRFFIGHSFFMMWTGFALTVLGVMLAQWMLLGIFHWQYVPFLPILAQSLLAIVIFPLPCWLLIHLQRIALSPR